MRKEYVKVVYCHPAYLIYMKSASCKKLGWVKHKLGSRLLGEVSITLDITLTILPDDTTLTGESEKELKSLLMKVKE